MISDVTATWHWHGLIFLMICWRPVCERHAWTAYFCGMVRIQNSTWSYLMDTTGNVASPSEIFPSQAWLSVFHFPIEDTIWVLHGRFRVWKCTIYTIMCVGRAPQTAKMSISNIHLLLGRFNLLALFWIDVAYIRVCRFDGDGMIHGLNRNNGKASYVARYVQTSKLQQ